MYVFINIHVHWVRADSYVTMTVYIQEGETTDLAQRQGHSVVKAEDNTNQSKYW